MPESTNLQRLRTALTTEKERRGKLRSLAGEAESSLASFTRQAWPYVEPFTRFVPGWHIDVLCEHFQAVSHGQISKLIITIPPGHMKSLLSCVAWPSWDWIERPWLRWMFSSYSSALSVRDHGKMGSLITSFWYRSNWGNRYSLLRRNDAKIENNKTGFRLATSVGGLGTGERVDVNVNDDLLRANDAHSEAMRKQADDHLRAMSTRAINPVTYKQVLIMQRLHQQDPVGMILEREKDWEVLRLPAEFEGKNRSRTSIGWEDPRQRDGDLLWPEMYPESEIQKLKVALGSYGASGQLQQNPAPLEGGVVKRKWWQRFPFSQRPESFETIIISADPKFKDYETESKVSIQVWGAIGSRRYLLDRRYDHMGILDTINAIDGLNKEWDKPEKGLHVDALLIEDKANGPAIIQVLRKKFPNVVAVEPRGSKIARALAVSPQIEAGSVYVQAEPWGDEVIDAWAFMPNGDNWDDIDAASQALDHLRSYTDEPAVAVLVGTMESSRESW